MPLFVLILILASSVFDAVAHSGIMPPQDPPRGQECERTRTKSVSDAAARL